MCESYLTIAALAYYSIYDIVPVEGIGLGEHPFDRRRTIVSGLRIRLTPMSRTFQDGDDDEDAINAALLLLLFPNAASCCLRIE